MDGQTDRVGLRRSQVQKPTEVTRNLSASARWAGALLSRPGCEQEGVPVLGRDRKQGPATAQPCSSPPCCRPLWLHPRDVMGQGSDSI